MAEIVKITKNQPFVLYVPLVILNGDGSKEAVEAVALTNVSVKLNSACEEQSATHNTFERYLVLDLPATLNVGVYAVIITATLPQGRQFSLRIKRAFEVVDWDIQSNWRDYLVGAHIELNDQPFIAGVFTTDADIERLKAELRASIAAAERQIAAAQAAKREWEQKAAELDDVAQQATLTQGVQDIRTDIAGIDIDTSDLAKEATLQQIIDADILRPNLQGFTFDTGWATDNIAAILAYVKTRMHGELYSEMTMSIASYAFQNCSKFTSANLPNATSVGSYAFEQCTGLITANLPNATSVGSHAFEQCTGLITANLPNVTSIATAAFSDCTGLRTANFHNVTSIAGDAFWECRSLYYLDISRVASISTRVFRNNYNLIDLHLGVYLEVSLNLSSAEWNPTNAYSNTSRSLVPADVQELHPEWPNRDYLLYCLREHFAANLPDRTGQTALTITFNATMKGYINNSPETVAAFTNKYWIIA